MNARSLLFLALTAATPALAQEPAPPAPVQSPAPAPLRLTLQEALRRALTDNTALGVARLEVNALKSQEGVIFSGVLPRIGFQGNFTRNDKAVTFGEGEDARTLLAENDWSYRLTLSQPVYAGNRERKAINQARLSVDIARHGVTGTEELVILNVASNYLAAVQAEELLAVEQRNLDLARRRRDQAQIFFEAGETTRVDVLRADADTKGAERRIAAARQAREAAVGNLRLALAVDGPIEVVAPGEFLPTLPGEAALVAEAEANRPELAQALANQEIARLEVAKQKGAYLPVVTADGAWIKQRAAFPTDQYGQLSLRVAVPIYSSGEIKGRIAIAQERQRQAELRVQEVKQQVREDVRQALVDLETAGASLQLAREQLTAAEAEYSQATELYRAQELTSLEIESAETSLAEARRAVTTGELDRNLAELRAWAAAGLLKKTIPSEGVQ
ncbi:MAG TPA: TolC family protein [Thermoanaerobaculia bacterium]|nr:TolC family protein [Thermoanaerobaculia bacterium]